MNRTNEYSAQLSAFYERAGDLLVCLIAMALVFGLACWVADKLDSAEHSRAER